MCTRRLRPQERPRRVAQRCSRRELLHRTWRRLWQQGKFTLFVGLLARQQALALALFALAELALMFVTLALALLLLGLLCRAVLRGEPKPQPKAPQRARLSARARR